MEESRKKPIMIAVIVVCFGVAAAITLRGRGPSDDVSSDETIWVKCANRACGHSFETNAKEYYKFQQDTYNPDTEESAGMTCPECGKPSVFPAKKCINPDCGYVFFPGEAGANDISDRCPKCKMSAFEESRKDTGG